MEFLALDSVTEEAFEVLLRSKGTIKVENGPVTEVWYNIHYFSGRVVIEFDGEVILYDSQLSPFLRKGAVEEVERLRRILNSYKDQQQPDKAG
ncbi:hypothetical protein HYV81_04800 [Candidatus Woesearchaeota archaeon]|nr:hypothetical protein [Candidatus Woesearchaeota archaeon]